MKTYKEIVAETKALLKFQVYCLRESNRIWNLEFKGLPETRTWAEAAIRRNAWKHRMEALIEGFEPFDSINWRALHIAYCLFRGKSIEQIEPNRKLNAVQSRVDRAARIYLDRWKTEAAEDIQKWESRRESTNNTSR
jgi:hypothetical protein